MWDINFEDEWDVFKKKKKFKSLLVDFLFYFVLVLEVGFEGGSKKKLKWWSLLGDDFNDWDGDFFDRKWVDFFEECDVSFVVFELCYDDCRCDSKSKWFLCYDDDDDIKFIVFVFGGFCKFKDFEKRFSGIFFSIFFKLNGYKDDDKKDFFLDNVGIFGVGVGLVGVVVVIVGVVLFC